VHLEVSRRSVEYMSSKQEGAPTRSGRLRGRPFAKGNGGRRPGSRNRSTRIAEALLPGEAGELVRKAIELAKAGDVPMLKFLLDRILPRDRPIKIALPQINNPHDATEALSAVTRAVAAGEIAPGEGAAVATMVAGFARLVDISTFEKRIETLESEIMELRSKS
jgi:hypothetical protein